MVSDQQQHRGRAGLLSWQVHREDGEAEPESELRVQPQLAMVRAEQPRACAPGQRGDIHPHPGGEGGGESEETALENAARLLDTQVTMETPDGQY